MEVCNSLPARRFLAADDYLAFLGIYEDRRRTAAYRRLIRSRRLSIADRTGVEAGAGLGETTRMLLDAGARRVYAVEENAHCVAFLRQRFRGDRRVTVVHERLQSFSPRRRIDFLLQELYGPLLLDESLLALQRIRFDPGTVLPDGGVLLAERVELASLRDPTINRFLLRRLEGVLVSDLFLRFRFRRPSPVLRWTFKRGLSFLSRRFRLKGHGEILALGMAIEHAGERIIGTEDSFNWPFVFTPVCGRSFQIRYRFSGRTTQVGFRWLRSAPYRKTAASPPQRCAGTGGCADDTDRQEA